ncbi:hypothetical protein GCM10017687_70060 [Streptomyces echinatus]
MCWHVLFRPGSGKAEEVLRIPASVGDEPAYLVYRQLDHRAAVRCVGIERQPFDSCSPTGQSSKSSEAETSGTGCMTITRG